jgi:predicted nucleotidyltransferase
MKRDEVKGQIVAKLNDKLSIHKVILFGSFASGKPDRDSDIDLLVVVEDDFLPRNYQESMELYLKVSAVLRDIKRSVPIDLIVHTKPMHDRFLQLGSMFSKEILKRGEVLYEKSH